MKDLIAQLDALIDTPINGMEIYTKELERLVKPTDEDEDGNAAHDRFMQICILADRAFSGAIAPSDEEARANPTTRPLMTLLLTALKDYRTRTLTGEPSATKRREDLAFAFGLSAGQHGGKRRGRNWNTELQMNLNTFFNETFSECRLVMSESDSWKRAFAMTYHHAFSTDPNDKSDHKKRMKNRSKLNRLLAEHGYGAASFQVNLNQRII